MKTLKVNLQGDRYEVSYHPHIIRFMIVANQQGQFLMMQDTEGHWRCLNDQRHYSDRLPVEQLYVHTERARTNGVQDRAFKSRRALL